MIAGELNILIVAENGRASTMIAKQLVLDLPCDITMVDTLEEARLLANSYHYDVILAQGRLSDGEGLDLVTRENGDVADASPLILLEGAVESDAILQAIRRGAADVFPEPLDLPRLVDSVQRVTTGHKKRKAAAGRSARLRRLTARVVRDRRELRQRVDLICRDLVQAYRRLAEKVVTIQEESTQDA